MQYTEASLCSLTLGNLNFVHLKIWQNSYFIATAVPRRVTAHIFSVSLNLSAKILQSIRLNREKKSCRDILQVCTKAKMTIILMFRIQVTNMITWLALGLHAFHFTFSIHNVHVLSVCDYINILSIHVCFLP